MHVVPPRLISDLSEFMCEFLSSYKDLSHCIIYYPDPV